MCVPVFGRVHKLGIELEAPALTGVLLALVGGHEVRVAHEEVEIQLVAWLCEKYASFVMKIT